MIRDMNSLFNTGGNCWAPHATICWEALILQLWPLECYFIIIFFLTCKLLYLLLQFRNNNYSREWLRLKIRPVNLWWGKHQGWVAISESWDDAEKCCARHRVKSFPSESLSTLCSPGLTQTCSSLRRSPAISFLQSPCGDEHPQSS